TAQPDSAALDKKCPSCRLVDCLHLLLARHRDHHARLSARLRHAPGSHFHPYGQRRAALDRRHVRLDDRCDGAAAARHRGSHANPEETFMALIVFDSVSKAYSGKAVLHDFSLSIEHGQRMAILGPSGCGKTTVLRLLAGFIAPDTGSISIDDEIVA